MRSVLSIILLCSCVFAQEKLHIKWQKTIESDSLSYVPHILKVDSGKQINVIGTSFNILDKNIEAGKVLWEYDAGNDKIRQTVLKTNIPSHISSFLMRPNECMIEFDNQIIFEDKDLDKSRLYKYDIGGLEVPQVVPADLYSIIPNSMLLKIIATQDNLFISYSKDNISKIIKIDVAGKVLYSKGVCSFKCVNGFKHFLSFFLIYFLRGFSWLIFGVSQIYRLSPFYTAIRSANLIAN